MAQKEQATANRNYKDTVFRMLFSDRQNLLFSAIYSKNLHFNLDF